MPDEREPPTESVLSNLPTFAWDMDKSVAYEVALEVIGHAVASYTALIHAERAKPEPDQDKITQWQAGRARCVAERNGLRSDDDAEVARVRREYPELAERLWRQVP